MSKCVVLGGTFNPLSKAHIYILKNAYKKLHADKMILLPTSDVFLNSWKKYDKNNILPISLREDILNEFALRNKNVIIENCEVNKLTYKTYDSLTYIKNKYGFTEIYFICGSEKLPELGLWYRIDDLLNEFKFVVYKRNNDDISSLIKNNKYVTNHFDNFVFFNSKMSLQEVSSTKIRENINNKKDVLQKYTYKYIINILRREYE